MPRPLKPYKVDHVRSSNGWTAVDVMFDRDRKKFFVEIVPGDADSRVYADTLESVKAQATTALTNAQTYTWTSLIVVSVSEHWRSSEGRDASIVMNFRRLERSPHPTRGNSFVERPHALDATGERTDRRDIEPCSVHDAIGPANDVREAVLLYRQDVWDGLVAIQDTINDARAKLEKLLRRKDVDRVLTTGAHSKHAQALRGVKLLTAPEED